MTKNQNNELQNFILENTNLLYDYINTQILNNIAKLDFDYFENIVQRSFIKNSDLLDNKYTENRNLLPYYILTLIEKNGKIDYTSSRIDTIDFTQLNKESSVYYNYAQFSLKGDFLSIELMQTKIGGMPIDKDIVKFTKTIPVKKSGLDEFMLRSNK